MKLKMNNLDKAKQDALNELTSDQSKLLIKQNTIQILNQIFSANPDHVQLDNLSERQITLTQFFYNKGFHFDMMHGIIDGCYDTLCNFYSKIIYNDLLIEFADVTNAVENYVLMIDLMLKMKDAKDKNLIKKSLQKPSDIGERLKNLQQTFDVNDLDDSELNSLIKMFDNAQKKAKSIK